MLLVGTDQAATRSNAFLWTLRDFRNLEAFRLFDPHRYADYPDYPLVACGMNREKRKSVLDRAGARQYCGPVQGDIGKE